MLGPMAPAPTDLEERDDLEERRHLWEDITTWPMMAVALVFLGAFAWPIVDTSLDPDVRRVCSVILAATWWTFLIDYVVRLVLARQRARFVRRHLIDLASVAIPVLRPLLLLRVISVFERALGRNLGSRLTVYVLALTGLAVGVGSLTVLSAEQGRPDGNIDDLDTALWWAVTTVTTVGYGDHYPVTGQGRLVAAVLIGADRPDRGGHRIPGLLHRGPGRTARGVGRAAHPPRGRGAGRRGAGAAVRSRPAA